MKVTVSTTYSCITTTHGSLFGRSDQVKGNINATTSLDHITQDHHLLLLLQILSLQLVLDSRDWTAIHYLEQTAGNLRGDQDTSVRLDESEEEKSIPAKHIQHERVLRLT